MSFLIFFLPSSANIFRAASQATGREVLYRDQATVSLSRCKRHIHVRTNCARLHWLGDAPSAMVPVSWFIIAGLGDLQGRLPLPLLLLNDNGYAIL